MDRSDVTFRSGSDDCAAWLYRPSSEQPAPIVVLGHGLGAVKDMGLAAYAERFVDAGFAALAFDYRGFGRSGGEPRQWLDVRRQLDDWQAAIDFARTVDDVDPDRVALFGTSFGGGHVIRAAARDQRVSAVISQCPFTSGSASLLTLGARSTSKVVPRAVRDLVAARLGRPPKGVALSGPPGSRALMTAPDADPGFRRLIPDGLDFDDTVDARIALHVPLHAPGRAAGKVRCPILFAVCEKDSVAPPGPTLRYAAKASQGEVKRYPVGHFEIYLGDPFEQAVADYVEFLTRHLG